MSNFLPKMRFSECSSIENASEILKDCLNRAPISNIEIEDLLTSEDAWEIYSGIITILKKLDGEIYMNKLHYLPDGRIKVRDHFIVDRVAIRIIQEMDNKIKTFRGILTESTNFPLQALKAILDTLELGSQKHEPGAWKEESTEHHAAKALGHLKDFVYGVTTNPSNEDTLAHALTRLAMAVSVREKRNDYHF